MDYPSIEEQEHQLAEDAKRRADQRKFDEGFAEYEASLRRPAGEAKPEEESNG